jgi:DNA-binding CsgD family transcriptional regulator
MHANASGEQGNACGEAEGDLPCTCAGFHHAVALCGVVVTLLGELPAGRRKVRMRPLILASDDQTFETAIDEMSSIGWNVHRDWLLVEREWSVSDARIVCCGVVATFDDVSAALLAAVRGAGVVARIEPGAEPAHRLREELSSLGPIEERAREHGDVTELTPEQIELCRLLGRGLSLTDAATLLHLSRRTAFRRLADVREALNVETTREAVLIACAAPPGGSAR